jgi:hypothetical protein
MVVTQSRGLSLCTAKLVDRLSVTGEILRDTVLDRSIRGRATDARNVRVGKVIQSGFSP